MYTKYPYWQLGKTAYGDDRNWQECSALLQSRQGWYYTCKCISTINANNKTISESSRNFAEETTGKIVALFAKTEEVALAA